MNPNLLPQWPANSGPAGRYATNANSSSGSSSSSNSTIGSPVLYARTDSIQRGAIALHPDVEKTLRELHATLKHADPTLLAESLKVFQALSNAGPCIESLLQAYDSVGVTLALDRSVQAFVNNFAEALRQSKHSLKGADLQTLEAISLGLAACLSLGQPNLFAMPPIPGDGRPVTFDVWLGRRQLNLFAIPGSAGSACAAALGYLINLIADRVQSLGLQALQDNPGPTLNIHNLVRVALASESLPASASMRGLSRLCLQAMQGWAECSDLSGLLSKPESRDFNAFVISRARLGDYAAQLDAMYSARWELLALDTNKPEGRGNLEILTRLLDWTCERLSTGGIVQLLPGQALTPLTRVANLAAAQLQAGRLNTSEASLKKLYPLPESLSNFMSLLSLLGQRDISALAACAGLIDALMQQCNANGNLPEARRLPAACLALLHPLIAFYDSAAHIDLANILRLLGFYRSTIDWISRDGALHAATANSGAWATTTTTLSSASTSTSTATTSTSTATTGATLTSATTAHVASYGDLQGACDLIHMLSFDWKASATYLVCRIDIRCERRVDVLSHLLHTLCQLRSRIVPAAVTDPLMATLFAKLADFRLEWPIASRVRVLDSVLALVKAGVLDISALQRLLTAVMETEPDDEAWTLDDIKLMRHSLKEDLPGAPEEDLDMHYTFDVLGRTEFWAGGRVEGKRHPDGPGLVSLSHPGASRSAQDAASSAALEPTINTTVPVHMCSNASV